MCLKAGALCTWQTQSSESAGYSRFSFVALQLTEGRRGVIRPLNASRPRLVSRAHKRPGCAVVTDARPRTERTEPFRCLARNLARRQRTMSAGIRRPDELLTFLMGEFPARHSEASLWVHGARQHRRSRRGNAAFTASSKGRGIWSLSPVRPAGFRGPRVEDSRHAVADLAPPARRLSVRCAA